MTRPLDIPTLPLTVGSAPSDYLALTKPRITTMVVVTMLAGAWLARRGGYGPLPAIAGSRLVIALFATSLVVGAANALNMVMERDCDGLMARTRTRPLPAGRLQPGAALGFALVLSVVGLALLAIFVNATTMGLAAVALVSYVGIYTPLKRITPLSLPIGAVPGAIPPLLGWTAVTGRIELPGVVLFGVLYFWQLPHFLAIATFRREDYARAGFKVLPIVRGDRVTRVHIVAYSVALLAMSIAPVPLGMGGLVYLVAAIALGTAFLGVGAWGLRPSSGVPWAKGLFVASVLYLVLLLTALMAST